jgi:D-glycero-D-manno-heptose 1,7-bisphosphate phosphatase
MTKPAIFLDRDGTLIEDAHYLSRPEQIKWLPGALESLKLLQDRGYLLIVITNQSGIGRGYFSAEDYLKVENAFKQQAADNATPFEAVYHCPHWPEKDGSCDCRKPGRGLFEKALQEHDIDITKSIAVGDRERDVIPANELGVSQSFVVPKEKGLFSVIEKLIS